MDFRRALIGNPPLEKAAGFLLRIKTAGWNDPPDETGSLEGTFDAPLEQVVFASGQLAKAVTELAIAYDIYKASAHGSTDSILCGRWDIQEVMDYLFRRMAVLAGPIHMESPETPPGTTNPEEIYKILLRKEQEVLSGINALQQVVGPENPMGHELKRLGVKSQERIDGLWRKLPREAAMVLESGNPPIEEGGEEYPELPPDEASEYAGAPEEIPEEMPVEEPVEGVGDPSMVAEEAPMVEEPVTPPSLEGKMASWKDYAIPMAVGAPVALALGAGGAYLGAPKQIKKQMSKEVHDPRLYPNTRGAVALENQKERIAAHKKLDRKTPHSVLSAMKEGFTRGGGEKSASARMRRALLKLAQEDAAMGAQMASPAQEQGNPQEEAVAYLQSEQIARAAQESNESQHYKMRFQQAVSENQGLQQQMMDTQQQLTGLQQQAQMASQQVQQVTQQAVQANDAAAQQAMLAAQMRMGMQQMRAQMLQVASQEPDVIAQQVQQQQAQAQAQQLQTELQPPAVAPEEAAAQQGAAALPTSPSKAVEEVQQADRAQMNAQEQATQAEQATQGAGAKMASVMDIAVPVLGAALGAHKPISDARAGEEGIERRRQAIAKLKEKGGFLNAMREARAKAGLGMAEVAVKHPILSSLAGAASGAVAGKGAKDILYNIKGVPEFAEKAPRFLKDLATHGSNPKAEREALREAHHAR